MKTYIVIVGIIILSITAISIHKYFFKSWMPYYKEKLYQSPSLLLQEASKFLDKDQNNKTALDLGAGVGNETAFLLKNGLQVWANDSEKESIKIISSRKDIDEYKQNLVIIHKNFTDLPWNNIPKFNLIYAGYSLPFMNNEDFKNIWKKITNALASNGIFAGNFFGIKHNTFNWWQKKKMTFVAKDELLKMFKDFKILFFEEIPEKNKKGIMEHSFNIIAQKL